MRRLLVPLGLIAITAIAWLALRTPEVRTVAAIETEHVRGEAAASAATLVDLGEDAEARRAAIAPTAVAPRDDATSVAHAPQQDERATLSVLVRARETSLPVAGVRVLATPTPDDFLAFSADRAEGEVGESLRTDADGRVTIRAHCAEQITVIVSHATTVRAAEIRVEPPLARDETREIVVLVPTLPDVEYCVRVVDAESSLPVVRAAISTGRDLLVADAADARITDGDGVACLRLRSWSGEPLIVRASGYGPRAVTPGRTHERDDPLVVGLTRSSALTIDAYDESGAPIVGERVELIGADDDLVTSEADGRSFPSFGTRTPTWDATTDATGAARFAELPSRVVLSASVTRPGRPRWCAPETIVLEPGEDRAVVWRIGSACTIRGRAVDVDGGTASGITIVLEPADEDDSGYFDEYPSDLERRETTGQDGGFAFADVGTGAWRIGAARTHASVAHDVAPVAQLVEVRAGLAFVDVLVRVERGAPIRGRVLDPDGRPVPGGNVRVNAVDGHAELYVDLHSRGGEFETTSLRPGAYDVVARGPHDRPHHASEPVRVLAGGPPLDVRLRAGARARGRVLDATTRELVDAQVVVTSGTDFLDASSLRSERTSNGSFDVSGLKPGSIVASARTADGRVGISAPVDVGPGGASEDVDVLVAAGGWIRASVREAGETPILVLLRYGRVLSIDPILGEDVKLAAPTGRTTVRLLVLATRAQHDVEIDLEAGATRALVFDGAWK